MFYKLSLLYINICIIILKIISTVIIIFTFRDISENNRDSGGWGNIF